MWYLFKCSIENMAWHSHFFEIFLFMLQIFHRFQLVCAHGDKNSTISKCVTEKEDTLFWNMMIYIWVKWLKKNSNMLSHLKNQFSVFKRQVLSSRVSAIWSMLEFQSVPLICFIVWWNLKNGTNIFSISCTETHHGLFEVQISQY